MVFMLLRRLAALWAGAMVMLLALGDWGSARTLSEAETALIRGGEWREVYDAACDTVGACDGSLDDCATYNGQGTACVTYARDREFLSWSTEDCVGKTGYACWRLVPMVDCAVTYNCQYNSETGECSRNIELYTGQAAQKCESYENWK